MSVTPEEKIKKELSKLEINEAIEIYHNTGKWLHEQIEKKKKGGKKGGRGC